MNIAARLYGLAMRGQSMTWHRIRTRLVNHILGRKHRELHIGPDVVFTDWRNLKLGDHVSINRGCEITPRGGLVIGDYVAIGHGSSILTVNHGFDGPVPIKYQPIDLAPVTIGDNVWIGCRCIILPGVTLAEGTIVGAGSVVTKSSEPYTTIAGNPARVIARRKRERMLRPADRIRTEERHRRLARTYAEILADAEDVYWDEAQIERAANHIRRKESHRASTPAT